MVSGMLALKIVLNEMTQVDWIAPAITIAIFSILLMWLKAHIFSPFTKKNKGKINDEEEKTLKDVYERVMNLLLEEKYFLTKNIKVSDMALKLNCSEKMVSNGINKYGAGNFNNLINTFRISYSKELFDSGKYDHYTIEAIAEESGFSNKVSFYNAFRSDTGMSPKQYKALKQS